MPHYSKKQNEYTKLQIGHALNNSVRSTRHLLKLLTKETAIISMVGTIFQYINTFWGSSFHYLRCQTQRSNVGIIQLFVGPAIDRTGVTGTYCYPSFWHEIPWKKIAIDNNILHKLQLLLSQLAVLESILWAIDKFCSFLFMHLSFIITPTYWSTLLGNRAWHEADIARVLIIKGFCERFISYGAIHKEI